jgi:hypothetical protein
MMCPHHHHLVHTAGWHVEMEPDGTLHITGPDGTVRTTRPPLLNDTLFPPDDAPQ